MEVKIGDFVEIEYDMYANDKLVKTTNKKKGEEANLQIEKYEPAILVIGKHLILEALDNAIERKTKDSIKLSPKEAFGVKEKKLIKTFPKSTFDKDNIRPIVGVVYNFNGIYGTVKAVTGGRILVDFNNPLSGKEIKIDYEVKKVIDDIKKKLEFVLELVLKIPKDKFKIDVNDLNIKIYLDKQILSFKEEIKNTINEYIFEFNEYKLEILDLNEFNNKNKKTESDKK